MQLGLQGRTAVITGGSMGMGKAIARGLAAEGVNLVLLARGKENVDKAAREIQSEHGVKVVAIPTNMTDRGMVDADLVVFLASDPARYINGTRIVIDGGLSVNAR